MNNNWYKKTDHPKWKYVLIEKMRFQLPVSYIELDIFSDKGELLAHLDCSGLLTIYPGYAWDGATCALDFKSALRATLIHDIMCQLVNHDHWTYDRFEADLLFFETAKKDRFVFARVYFYGVAVFGILHTICFPNKKQKGIYTKESRWCFGKIW